MVTGAKRGKKIKTEKLHQLIYLSLSSSFPWTACFYLLLPCRYKIDKCKEFPLSAAAYAKQPKIVELLLEQVRERETKET